jgi:hypothetical protein
MPTKPEKAHEEVAAMLGGRIPELPSKKQQSWGAMLSIIIIMVMVVLGAYYAFEKRVGTYTNQMPSVELGGY